MKSSSVQTVDKQLVPFNFQAKSQVFVQMSFFEKLPHSIPYLRGKKFEVAMF
jgi:hypothetical protein